MFDAFTGEFAVRGTAELVLIGATCGAVGVWIIWLGRAFLAESLTHALLPGLVVAATVGGGPVLGAVVGALVAWLLIAGLERAPKISIPSANAGGVTLLLGAGALLAAGNSEIAGFEAILFGDPLTASTGDVIAAAAFAAGIAAGLTLLHDRLKALVFDRPGAVGVGLRALPVTLASFALIVLTISVAATSAGNLLAFALLVAPAAAGMILVRGLVASLVAASTIGSACGLIGVLLSYHADLPVSACVALVAAASVPAAQAVTSARRLGTSRPL